MTKPLSLSCRALLFSLLTITASYPQESAGEMSIDSLTIDTTAISLVDTVTAAEMELPVVRVVPPLLVDSLYNVVFHRWLEIDAFPDWPQNSLHWRLDPNLFRVAASMWGSPEAFYPLGLSASHLGRSDNLFGDHAFSNPIPLPTSEEFLRVDIADQQILLPPGWSQLSSPFGRTAQVYQCRQIERRDTSETSLYVIRGRGAFSNTIFRFQNYFGPSFNLSADGNFQQNTGLILLSDHKLDRIRFVAEPNVGDRSSLAIAFQLSRLKGSKLFFPGGYQYRGNYSDNYSAVAIVGDRVTSPGVLYRLQAAYKNDDQKFFATGLRSAQRFRLLDLSLAHQRPMANQTVELGLDLRILRFSDGDESDDLQYFNLAFADRWSASSSVSLFGQAAIRGSNDLKPQLAVTGVADVKFTPSLSLTLLTSRSPILPQPEMQYLRPRETTFPPDSIDYHISGYRELESGIANTMEWLGSYRRSAFDLLARVGYARLSDVAEWRYLHYIETGRSFTATEADRRVLWASLQAKLRPLPRVTGYFAYGVRRVEEEGENLTLGPEHNGLFYLWYRFGVRRYQVDLNIGCGGRFYSALNRHQIGGAEDGTFIAETYLSFDLKRFHFYLNYTNLFDIDYSVSGIFQPGRSIWWGFEWSFVD